MHLKLPNNTILFHDNYKLNSVNELLDEVSQKTAFHEFEASVKKVKTLHPSFALDDLNILNLYYRDFYELYFTAKKMQTLITRVKSGEKITIRSGNFYILEIIFFLRKSGFKNINFYGGSLFYTYLKLKNFMINTIKLLISCITLLKIFFTKKNKFLFGVHTSNNIISKTQPYDSRYMDFFELLSKHKMLPILFIRTNHGVRKVLRNYFARKYPAVYSDSIIYFGKLLNKMPLRKIKPSIRDLDIIEQITFTSRNLDDKSHLLSIKVLKKIYAFTKIKCLFIPDKSERQIIDMISAKLVNIKTIGITNGHEYRYFQVQRYMESLDKPNYLLGHDILGVSSKYWLGYFQSYSKCYKPSSIRISGWWRSEGLNPSNIPYNKNIKSILWLAESLTPLNDVSNFLDQLLKLNYKVTIKARAMQDDKPDTLIDDFKSYYGNSVNYFYGTMNELNKENYDLAIGSYTTAILDSLIMGIPVLLLYTNTWGDAFYVKDHPYASILCNDPEDLINKIENLPLKKIQDFKDDIYEENLDGAQWCIDQIKKEINV
jgi:hypothetical protein